MRVYVIRCTKDSKYLTRMNQSPEWHTDLSIAKSFCSRIQAIEYMTAYHRGHIGFAVDWDISIDAIHPLNIR
jgi:hypothetical protein